MGLKSKIKGTLRPDRYVEALPVSQGEVMAGRAVLVTGGTSGIGRATVELLVRCRAEVVFTGGPDNRALAEMETELSATAHGIEYDVGRQPVGDLLARAAGVLEGLPDYLFANADVYADGEVVWDADSVERVLRVNLVATIEFVNAFVGRLVTEGRAAQSLPRGRTAALCRMRCPTDSRRQRCASSSKALRASTAKTAYGSTSWRRI